MDHKCFNGEGCSFRQSPNVIILFCKFILGSGPKDLKLAFLFFVHCMNRLETLLRSSFN